MPFKLGNQCDQFLNEKFPLLKRMKDGVLNERGNKDKLCPLAPQVAFSEFHYTQFYSLIVDLFRNVSRLGLREPTCNMEMRD